MTVGALAREAVTGFFFSNQRLSQSETLKFREELSKIKPVSRRERIMQWTNPWIEAGMQLGRTEGMQEGRRQEAANLVLRQLRRRLGSVSAEEEEAVQSLPIRRLESLGEALLDFKRAADLSAWLRRHSSRRRRAR